MVDAPKPSNPIAALHVGRLTSQCFCKGWDPWDVGQLSRRWLTRDGQVLRATKRSPIIGLAHCPYRPLPHSQLHRATLNKVADSAGQSSNLHLRTLLLRREGVMATEPPPPRQGFWWLWWCVVVCRGEPWWAVVGRGGLWWVVGGLWWVVVGCGGLWWVAVLTQCNACMSRHVQLIKKAGAIAPASSLGMGQEGLAARWSLQFTPMCGFVQLLKINSQNRHEMGHQSSACAQQFQRTRKLTADSLPFANNVHLTERFNHGPNSRGSARGWRKGCAPDVSWSA